MDAIVGTLRSYFRGEVQGGIGFASVGALAVVVAVLLWRSQNAHRAMLWPLLVLGLVELAIGIGVSARTPRQVATLEAQIEHSPQTFRSEEAARMRRVMRSFAIVETVEVVLLAAAVVVAWTRPSHPVWFGVALGLIAQCSALLVMDLLAEHRARIYLAAIEAFGGS